MTSALSEDTILALGTPPGFSAIGVIRLSGSRAVALVNAVFRGADLSRQASHTLHYGRIVNGDATVDEVVVGLFLAPRSYTKRTLSRSPATVRLFFSKRS